MTKTAVKISDLDTLWAHEASLYRMEPPLERQEFIVVASSMAYAVCEDFFTASIFAADSSGKVLDWQPMSGSLTGTLDREKVLSDLGYEIVSGG